MLLEWQAFQFTKKRCQLQQVQELDHSSGSVQIPVLPPPQAQAHQTS